MKLFSRSVFLFALLLASSVACAQDAPSLETDIAPWIALIKGEYPQFTVSGWAEPVIDGRPQRINMRIVR